MNILKKQGGFALVEENNQLLFVDFESHYLYLLTYLALLFGVIFGFNGIGHLVLGNTMIGTILTIVGVGAAIIFWLVQNSRKVKEQLQTRTHKVLATIDKETKEFVLPNAKRYPLSAVKFNYERVIISSSKFLVARTKDQKVILAKGNPFIFVIEPFRNEFPSIIQQLKT